LYWELIEGKKLEYPLSDLMEVVKSKAMESEASIMKTERARLKQGNQNNSRGYNKISTNRINGVEIYEMSKGLNNEFAFYSYARDSLNESALNEYSTLLSIKGKFYLKFCIYF
jgi:hypothetical protein